MEEIFGVGPLSAGVVQAGTFASFEVLSGQTTRVTSRTAGTPLLSTLD